MIFFKCFVMMVLGVTRVKTATFLTANQKANVKKSLLSQVTNCSSNYLIHTIVSQFILKYENTRLSVLSLFL